MTIKELVKDLRICSNPNVTCFECTYCNECTLGGVEYVSKNRSALFENAADVIEAFMKLCELGAFKIDEYYPYELDDSMINGLCEAFEEKPF